MPPVVLLKTPVDIGARDTTLEVGSNASPSEQSAIQQYVKTQKAIEESFQREAQTFRAAQALKECLAAQAATDIQRLMGPVAALKEQIAAAQAHSALRIYSHWKEDQERARRLAASFQPLIDSRWTEAQERLHTLGAPLKAIHERVREAFQLLQPVQHAVLQVQKKFREFATPFQDFFQDLKARWQPFIDWITSEALQEEWQRSRDINTISHAYCPIYRERYPEYQQDDQLNAAVTRLIAQLHPGLRNPRAARALRQQAAAQHTSPQDFLRTVVFPAAIRLVAGEVTSSWRMRVGREWVRDMYGKILVASPVRLRFRDFNYWFFSQVYAAAAAIVLDEVYPRPTTQQAQVLVYEEDALERLTAPASPGACDSAMLTALLQAEERDPVDQLHRMLTVASPRARELFRLLRQGLSIKEAAAELRMSPATAYVHVYRTRVKGRRR
jgi:DNA-binding CsgD family transcriptional regulator